MQRPRIEAAVVAAAAAGSVIALGLFGAPELGTTCPLRFATGLLCPLCGGTHATAALARGDWAAAWQHNAAVTAAAPILVAAFIWAVATRFRGEDWPDGRKYWWAIIAVGLTWTVARNFGGW